MQHSYWEVYALIRNWMNRGEFKDWEHHPSHLIDMVFPKWEDTHSYPIMVEDSSWLFSPHGLTLLKAKIARLK